MSFNGTEGWQIHDPSGRRKYLSAAESGRFLAIADSLDPWRRALCHLLAHTGCRLSEALALTTHRFDAEQRTVTFRTLKRRRVCFRTVPVPDAVRDMLTRIVAAEDGRFWPVHRTTVWRWLKPAMRRAGIAGPMASPKGLRHGFGMRAAGYDIPLPMIQKWMGHASLATTAIYLDAVGSEERQFASRMW